MLDEVGNCCTQDFEIIMITSIIKDFGHILFVKCKLKLVFITYIEAVTAFQIQTDNNLKNI